MTKSIEPLVDSLRYIYVWLHSRCGMEISQKLLQEIYKCYRESG